MRWRIVVIREVVNSMNSEYIPSVISGALTGFQAGACTGAVTGALVSRVFDSGLLRGAGLGAVVGAILSVEVSEASRAYWCFDSSRNSSSMADFVEQLHRGRFVEEPFPSPVLATYHWQPSCNEGVAQQITTRIAMSCCFE